VKKPRILIIGATHGNELLGVKLYERMLERGLPLLEHIDFMIGNPRAFAAKKRYIECDLNRSYAVEHPEKYEEVRAAEIAAYIKQTQPDLVLDMHTTVCDQPPCIILDNLNGETKHKFLRSSHIDTLLQINPLGDILMLGNNVLGYEVANKDITTELVDSIMDDIQNFLEGNEGSPTKQLFVMSDKIYKKDVSLQDAASFVNFKMHSLGFVPIMTGNANSYERETDYLGFKAAQPVELQF
jgi:hypothetical protein